MGNTIMGAVVSRDGYIADTNGDVVLLFDWYGHGDVEWKVTEKKELPCRTTKASRDFMRAVCPQIGAVVIGRDLFDHTNGWDAVPAWGDHVFVFSQVTPPLYDVERTAVQGEAARC